MTEAGVPRVHLGMLTTNTSARAFYDRLGFHEIAVADAGPVTYLGIATGR
jgi:ribosomal protein S18 acetylase RimI-like enzyme